MRQSVRSNSQLRLEGNYYVMEDNDRKGSDRRRQKLNTDMTAEPLQAVLIQEATPYQDLDDRQINVDLVNTTAVPVLAKLAEPLERT